ncbi:MAG: cellulase family glycosylhydrolase [Tepidisphaerales bacterium]
MSPRLLLLACLLPVLSACSGPAMESVRISGDGRGFVLHPSGKPFTPWGMNYSSNDIEDRWDKDWPGVERDLIELKRLGANVLRIHLQFNRFMAGPEQLKGHAFEQLGRFLKLAETNGLYLDITGLACYTPADNQPWYDALDEQQRWAAQARFWQEVARRCASSPAVFCYDLMNEPVSPGGDGRKPGQWYSGTLFGGFDYLQWIALAQGSRARDAIARDWARTLVAAIRKEDGKHLVTVGLLPTLKGTYFFGFVPATLAPEVDFISVHIYPTHEDPAEAMRILRQFVVAGKPLVIEETFPLSCSADELRRFLLDSRGIACGWIGHYLGKTRKELEEMKQSGRLSMPDAISLSWLELFEAMRSQMVGGEAVR